MDANENLQKQVQDALKWEPLLHAAEIGVTAIDGVVTLTGIVDSYTKKLQAEDATKNVSGVKAIVGKIEIKFADSGEKTDHEIANDILSALKWNWQVPSNKIKTKVENGWVTLDGELHWNYQREAAKKAIDNLKGVKGVSNDIKIIAESQDEVEKAAIEKAFVRSSSINNKKIQVKVSGNNVRLTGIVDSLFQKEEAARIAWSAPGVISINNELEIKHGDELLGLVE
ncbi:MAG: BON domain-containing protein [Bacteroidetes bacterium]|nr:BON domain-containing protein [Bacteroidota bacterium]